MVRGRITRGRHTDSPGLRHSTRTNQQSISINPLIFTPDALPAATLQIYPGLGQTQECAGLYIPVAWFYINYTYGICCYQAHWKFDGCRTTVTETWCFRWRICQAPRGWQCPSLKQDDFAMSMTVERCLVSAVPLLFTARRYASAVYVVALCSPVLHKPVLYQNG